MELDPTQDPFSREAIQHLVARYGSPLARHRCRARASAISPPRRGAAGRRSALRLKAAAARLADHHAACARARSSTWRPTAKSNWCGAWESTPERCIHTHPIKRDSDIRTALSLRRRIVSSSTIPTSCANSCKFRTRASLLIRVSFRSPDAQVRFVAQIRLRPGSGRGTVAARGGTAHQDRRTCHFMPARRHADSAMMVKAIEVCRELLQVAARGGSSRCTSSISAAAFRWII